MAEPCTFEAYASANGASRQDVGDAGLHKTQTRISAKVWARKVAAQSAKDALWMERRAVLRVEYAAKVAAGELREPTHRERLEEAAAGHPDRPDVQAARRLLAKLNGQGAQS